MFKKIQNHLLLHHPLLWNTRVVPVITISIVIHIIFFIAGFIHGEVDFSADNGYSYSNIEELAVFLSVVISILLTAVWLVFYLRNNAFKSFYPKQRLSLFKEWLILLVTGIVICSFVCSFFYGEDVRKRSYFTEEELNERIQIIKMASVFTDGPFEEPETISQFINGEEVVIRRDSFEFNNRKYSLKSLINRSTVSIGTSRMSFGDSIPGKRIKSLMAANQKDSVLWVMREFNKIAESHGAKGNITPQQWLDKVYDYPEYTKYIKIGMADYDYIDILQYEAGRTYTYEDDYPYVEEVMVTDTVAAANRNVVQLDTASFKKVMIEEQAYVQHKYFVPRKQLVNAYSDMAGAYYSPSMHVDALVFVLYCGLGISLLIFSFRVTSGKSWLIAAVAFGIVALITGILNLVISYFFLRDTFYRRFDEEMYFILWIVIVAVLMVYFLRRKNTKGISAIALNIIIWLTPAILPTIGFMLDTYYSRTTVYEEGVRLTPYRPMEVFLQEQPMLYMAICFVIYVVFMYFFSGSIKKWRGIAEA